MNRRLLSASLAGIILVIAVVFLIPVIPATIPAAEVQFPFHYLKSISSLFSPYGTSYWNGRFYFSPKPPFNYTFV